MTKPLASLFTPSNTRAVAAGCVALAVGGVVLLRAPRSSTATPRTAAEIARPEARRTPAGTTPAPTSTFAGPGVHGRIALSHGQVQPGSGQTVYAEIRVTADEVPNLPPRPVAFAMVLDVSGSMSGEKIEQARNAVRSVVSQMRDNDQISLVTYSDAARVLQPLARVGSVRGQLQHLISTIGIEGGTNIPAGLRAGAESLRDAPDGYVHRVVLMSDGRDGSGLSIDGLSTEVRQRADRGVTLSSLGIGADYDESFMSRLADAGRGNYEFLRNGAQLQTFLTRELEQSGRTTVDLAEVELGLPRGWTLRRVYGAEAEAQGQRVRLPVGALFAGEERRLVAAFTVDRDATVDSAGALDALTSRVAWRQVARQSMASVTPDALALRLARDAAEADASRNLSVFAEAESTALAARQAEAVVAWRDGRADEAERLSASNMAQLQQLQAVAPSPALTAQINQYNRDRSAFNNLSAGSEAGRAYGLGSNAIHRRAMRSSAAY
ncbi:MAG: VWA domain-containing protein [Myxococcales bacterium]|nr:VWA domain-containing protein [Myxococcales bacterium]